MDLFDAMQMFVRVVERGSFSAVARELNLGQPAVSKQIRALEQHLGGALFARSTRHLALTDQGQRFYIHSKEILSSLDTARLSFTRGQEQIAGPLRVAAPVSFGRLCIAPLMREFLARHPQVQIDLKLNDQNEDVLKENIDVAIRIGVVKNEGLVAVSLGDSPRRVYAAPAYLQQHGTPLEPADLARHNCLGFTLLEHYDVWRFDQQDKQHRVTIKGNVTSNSSEAIREMVLSGLGISLSPQWLFAADVRQGTVSSLLEAYQPVALPISAVFSQDRRRSARTRAFVDFLRERL
ncbi:LysR family transcriptional regulator [Pseudomonas sp. Fig-3]|uniref:LysR family transcriptional regulator n=1 Tax=Pseudomonas rhizophila TaxID=2045200 RepID=A0ABN5JQ22_9PSED|nr:MULTISPECIES: LysR family transcriptional regulator [Pseudomonas]AVU73994.1 LysR family transcriptional regulator [Pseudomonas rhizophila]MBD0706715.1 LysR family transcriptional regulator [Pseudomonas sp. PSB1]MDD2032980.1 LysR family transcriptional regulator [Pseudomonas sp. 39167]MDR8389030.1 LysR family transcriptional regulator [Pseudomonas sp. JL2]QKJ33380.1 LysR family transcriptional regulator [Pseudomonas sp. MPDS]